MKLLDRIGGVKDRTKRLTSVPSTHQIQFVDRKVIDALLKSDKWPEQFYRRYPKACGLAEVSVPVYSTDHKQTLVYFSFDRGFEFAGGVFGGSYFYYHLEKKNGKWEMAGGIGSV
jgi:hypothetical protein